MNAIKFMSKKTTCHCFSVHRQTVKKIRYFLDVFGNIHFECNQKFIFLLKHVHCAFTSKFYRKNVINVSLNNIAEGSYELRRS